MYPTLEPFSSELLWILILAFVIAFFLSFGVGANDVSNSFGTSVGSKVVTFRQACVMATIFEILGAVTLGYQVSATIRTGMIDINQYAGETKLLAIGYLSSLLGSAIWNILATFLKIPISGTHSIVGSIIGFSIVAKGFGSVQWLQILKIVASWFISPTLSGLLSTALFVVMLTLIIKKEKPLEPGLLALPFFYGFTIMINIFSIVHDGPYILSYLTLWMALAISFVTAIIVAIGIWVFVVPRQKRTICDKLNQINNNSVNKFEGRVSLTPMPVIKQSQDEELKNTPVADNIKTITNEVSKNENCHDIETFDKQTAVEIVEPDKEPSPNVDKPEVHHLFSYLQILTACFGAFAHGANDVSNAIGPLVAIVLIYYEGDIQQHGGTPWYLLLYGGVGISVGLWVWGRPVIETVGKNLTKITPSSGFSIEIGAATTVLLASKFGLPISTTHCKIGSIVIVGRIRAKESVDWSLLRNIVIAWLLTVPVSALCSGGSMALLQMLV